MFESTAAPSLSTHHESKKDRSTVFNGWGAAMEVAVCEKCHWRYLLQSGASAPICPNCWAGQLTVIAGELPEKANTAPPELVLPYSLTTSALNKSLLDFCSGVPFAPLGLAPDKIRASLTKVFLPMWLVDANIFAFWQAEAGFDYQVISHQEVFDERLPGWQSKEIKEPRIRWENRVGRLKRAYQNIAVPAIEEASRLEKEIGSFHREEALLYNVEELGTGIVRLPDISPKDPWNEVVNAMQKAAANECRMACGADHLREFRWKAQFSRQNWTLMLMPVYASSYRDDYGEIHPVLIHGQTGMVSGKRRASTKRAFRESLMIFGAGLLIFLMGLLMAFIFPDLNQATSAISSYIILLGFFCVLGSSAPYLVAWDFNRKQDLARAQLK